MLSFQGFYPNVAVTVGTIFPSFSYSAMLCTWTILTIFHFKILILLNQVGPIEVTDLFYKADLAKNGSNSELQQQIKKKTHICTQTTWTQ